MNIKSRTLLLAACFVILAGLGLQAQNVPTGRQMDDPALTDTVGRSIDGYFTRATKATKTPNDEGFILCWNPSANPTGATRFLPTAT